MDIPDNCTLRIYIHPRARYCILVFQLLYLIYSMLAWDWRRREIVAEPALLRKASDTKERMRCIKFLIKFTRWNYRKIGESKLTTSYNTSAVLTRKTSI